MWLHDRATGTHMHCLLRQGFSSWGEAKASNLSLSCLSLALIKAYNELGTGTQPQDRWLYGPGQIITLCGLRLSPGENRKTESDGKRGTGGGREREGGVGQRLKFYTPTFKILQYSCHVKNLLQMHFVRCVPRLPTLAWNKCSKFW